MRTQSAPPSFGGSRQRGAVLVVSLLLLLVMTALALTASQTTLLQERMAGNLRDSEMSFQAGEAGLRTAENRIDVELRPQGNLVLVQQKGDLNNDYLQSTGTWWADNGSAFSGSLDGVLLPPVYFTSLWADVKDTITMGSSLPASGTLYYASIARSVGGSDKAITLVETTYAVRY